MIGLKPRLDALSVSELLSCAVACPNARQGHPGVERFVCELDVNG